MSLFTQLYKSLYSPKDIARFRFQKIGKTILYILLLSLFAILPEGIQISNMLKTEIAFIQEVVDSQTPDFTIENGELKATANEPIIKKENDFTYLFDPSATVIPAKSLHEDGIFFLKDRMMIIVTGKEKTYSYSAFREFPIKKQDVQDFLKFVQNIYPIALLIIGVLLFLLDSFLSFLGITILAFLCVLISKEMGRKLNYQQAWTLTAYSFTLPTIFFMIMNYLNTVVPGSFFIFTMVAAIMLYATIKEIPAPKK
ncbi:DUF1189 domain-containing protein [Microbacteriaceae bacterium 4G12]